MRPRATITDRECVPTFAAGLHRASRILQSSFDYTLLVNIAFASTKKTAFKRRLLKKYCSNLLVVRILARSVTQQSLNLFCIPLFGFHCVIYILHILILLNLLNKLVDFDACLRTDFHQFAVRNAGELS